MDSAGRTPSIEALLAHAGWMRSLALAIVRDPAAAEDLVQDAWVVALQRPPAPRTAAGLRAWLSGVVSNLAHGRRRRERERGAVERGAARAESVSGDVDAVERLQLQRELTEVLLELREPYRSAVILRHIEGLSSEEIGLRSNCSAEAARQRVARGLAELRQRLRSRPGRGGDDRWLALVGFARASQPLTSAGAGTGAVVMSKTAWTTVSIAFGLLAAWMTWSALHVEPTAAPASRADAVADASSAADSQPGTRLDLEQRGAPNERSAALLPAAEARASLVVRDKDGAPLEGVSIAERGGAAPWGTTDGHGRFELPREETATSKAVILATASHDDFVSADVELAPGKTGELTLLRKPRVIFELAAPSGTPIEPPWTASVWVRDAATGESVQVRAEGERELGARRLPVGRLERAEARARGFATGQRAFRTELEPETVLRVRIELLAGSTVTGRVLDAATREPIAGAKVFAEGAFFDADSVSDWSTTDDEGRYELHGLQSQIVHDDKGQLPVDLLWMQVSATAEGYQGKLLEGKVQQRNEENRYVVDLELTRTNCRLRGRVLGMEGLAGRVMVQSVSANGQFGYAFPDSEGRFAIENLEPGVVWLLASNSHSYAERGEQDLDPQVCARANTVLAAGEDKEVELALERGSAGASGRVVDVHGEPVAGVEVRANLTERLGMIAWSPFHSSARTNQAGEFAFEGLLSGEYSFEFGEVPNGLCVVENFVSFELQPGGHHAGARLLLGECVSVEGWVDLNGHDPAGLRVQARAPGDQGLRVESPVAADASFRLVKLPGVELELVLLEGDREIARVAVGSRGARGVQLRAGD